MKKIIFISLLLILTYAKSEACTQFAGTYRFPANQNSGFLMVYQPSCEVFEAKYNYSNGMSIPRNLIIDGQRRQIENGPDIITWQKNSWQNDKIMIDEDSEWVKTQELGKMQTVISLDENGNLIETTYYFATGSTTRIVGESQQIYIKVK